jgi:pimeloyl-ACP methyl ester carboxylesterase
MSYPAGLHVMTRAADPAAASEGGGAGATVILVHGSLDRAESFRRVMRRLREVTTVAYDRRGYQESRAAGVVDMGGHMVDLLEVAEEVRRTSPGPLVAIGHSLGGDVVVGAAVAEPRAFDAIGAFEPPMPWLGFRRSDIGDDRPRSWAPMADDPGEEAERFFGRMVSQSAWERLTEEGKATRRADGPALVADLTSMRGPTPFDVMALEVPAVFGMGGLGAEHHRRAVTWLGANVPGAMAYEIEGSHHGAHLSHPDHFAHFVRLVLEQAGAGDGAVGA